MLCRNGISLQLEVTEHGHVLGFFTFASRNLQCFVHSFRRALYPPCPELMHGDFAIVDVIDPTKSETLELEKAVPFFCLSRLYRAGSKICDAMHRGTEKG